MRDLTEPIIHWKCEGPGVGEQEGLETTSRFLIWANGDAVTETGNPGEEQVRCEILTHGTSV